MHCDRHVHRKITSDVLQKYGNIFESNGWVTVDNSKCEHINVKKKTLNLTDDDDDDDVSDLCVPFLSLGITYLSSSE